MTLTQPEIVSLRREADTVCLTLRIPEALDYFRGHFDPVPLLPGVVQVDWAIRLAQQHFGFAPAFKRISALKFMRVITPGTQLTLTLDWQAATSELRFRYEAADSLYSSGQVLFGDA